MEPTELMARMVGIRERIAKLSAYPERAFSGLPLGRIRLAPPLREEQVAEWESHFSVQLPEDYRTFICMVGDGDIKPGLGFKSLLSLRVPLASPQQATPFPHTASWNPILKYDHDSFSREQWREIERDYFDDRHVAGTIDLFHGPTDMLLVVCGAERGNLWFDQRSYDGGLFPIGGSSWGTHGEDTGKRVTFLAYYEGELNALLGEAEKYSRRTTG